MDLPITSHTWQAKLPGDQHYQWKHLMKQAAIGRGRLIIMF
jgi:hypothetical protein